MVYVALLRGINVGGNNKVDMKQLKAVFEVAGMTSVQTYINSGNIIFADQAHDRKELVGVLESAIAETFGFVVKVLLRTADEMTNTTRALPDSWQTNTLTRCEVLFLWEDADRASILKDVSVKPDIDHLKYVPGALLWFFERKYATKSGLHKIIGTPLYAQMTLRNCNTVRKLAERMVQVED